MLCGGNCIFVILCFQESMSNYSHKSVWYCAKPTLKDFCCVMHVVSVDLWAISTGHALMLPCRRLDEYLVILH